MAKRSVARKAKPDPSGDGRPNLTVNLALTRGHLETLTAPAIREGKALRGLIDELFAAAANATDAALAPLGTVIRELLPSPFTVVALRPHPPQP